MEGRLHTEVEPNWEERNNQRRVRDAVLEGEMGNPDINECGKEEIVIPKSYQHNYSLYPAK